ncbi:unnamed protein product [Mytilus coruscus]|uniref:Uncharacterized protein n=1 Tax=Mytilus coruscus TaxID=42192 RepID=A0A6J8AE89_MYTCO|nr:unnamed protein product [Mytilus coruscus]
MEIPRQNKHWNTSSSDIATGNYSGLFISAVLDLTVTRSIEDSADWIAVQDRDILGWYTPNLPIAAYDGGQQVRKVAGNVVASNFTYDWGSVVATSNRDYGLHAVLSPGTTTFSLYQTGLDTHYFDFSDSEDIYLIQSLNLYFYTGTTLSFTATVTDSGGLTDTTGIEVIVSEYTTSTSSTTTERLILFWEDSKNIAWFIVLMLILLAVTCLLILWILTGANCSKLLAACKGRP